MTDDLFTYAASLPAHQRHSPTSKAAAEAIRPRIGPMHAAILAYLRGTQEPWWGTNEGATDEEMQSALDMPQNTQRHRRCGLQTAGLIIDSGRTRATKSGRQAVVWMIAR